MNSGERKGLPGKGKRVLGSLVTVLGGGLVLETPFNSAGIGLIIVGILLLLVGIIQGRFREGNRYPWVMKGKRV